MASIRLGRYELEHYDLPPVCAKCGQKAVTRPEKTFSWHPPWVGVLILAALLVYAIVAAILTKRMTVSLPFCHRHRNYWLNRAILLYGGLLALVVLGGGGLVVIGLRDDHGLDDPFGFVCAGTALLFIIWLIAVAIVQVASIRPAEITDKSITLLGLSREFVEAVREDRRGSSDEDEEYRPSRKRATEADEERRVRQRRALDDGPRSRRRVEDEDDGGYYDPEARRRRRDSDDEDDR